MPENKVSKLYQTAEELETPEIAHINGAIPDYVKGNFLRTGPAKWDFPQSDHLNHWLDGHAMISKFSIKGDEVKFQKKFLQSDAYQRAVKAGKIVITEFGTAKHADPNKGFFGRLVSAVMPIELSDNNSIALFNMGKELFTTGETCFFRKLEESTLVTGDKHDTNKCFGTNIACSHPLFDEEGAMYNIGSTVITGTKYNIIRVPPPTHKNESAKDLLKKSQIICSIPSRWTGLMSYNHSFLMTANYLIFIEQPFVMNLAKAAMTYLKNPAFRDWLEWKPELKNRIYVVEKATGKLMKTEYLSKDPFFFLHQINAYEENDQIVMDLAAYDSPNFLDSMSMSSLRQGNLTLESLASCHRYVIPIIGNIKDVPEHIDLVAIKSDAHAIRVSESIILTPEVLTQAGLEMPMLNKSFMGRKYNYFYAAGNSAGTPFSNALCKVKVSKPAETFIWRNATDPESYFPGEPTFIPNPNGKSEDDGVMISAVSSSRDDNSDFLLFLDARSFKEIGRAQFKNNIPQGLHGIMLLE